MSLSKMSEKCKGCPEQDTCTHKKMECVGILQPSAETISSNISMPMLQPHDYRQVTIAPNTTVTIDLEDLKKELEDRIYRSIGVPCIGTQFGA